MFILIELLVFALLSIWVIAVCLRCALVVHSLRRLASTPAIYVPRIA